MVMEFISFVRNADLVFWVMLVAGVTLGYLLAVLKVIMVDVKDVKLSYGPYCSNLKPLYKPYKKCFKEALTNEWRFMIVFVIIYFVFNFVIHR